MQGIITIRVPGQILLSSTLFYRALLICCRVYKNYDPRARIIKKVSDEVFAITGKAPLIQVSLHLVADIFSCALSCPVSPAQVPDWHA